ncbi:MAG TPA: PAP/fibrillin family protein [Leptolyngbyaceae cyanobacterium]
MVIDRTAQTTLKTELLKQIRAFTPQQALFPSKNESINQLVQQLELINPIPQPLSTENLPCLLGNWQLIYASRGTVVTRRINNIWEGITIKQIWQYLTAGSSNEIVVENGALIELAWLGTWQLKAEGIWQLGTDEQVAKVSFNAFSSQLMNMFNQTNWSLPELKIPVLEFLRNEAAWTTSYLDEDLRFGRGATGNLFVFHRQSDVIGKY